MTQKKKFKDTRPQNVIKEEKAINAFMRNFRNDDTQSIFVKAVRDMARAPMGAGFDDQPQIDRVAEMLRDDPENRETRFDYLLGVMLDPSMQKPTMDHGMAKLRAVHGAYRVLVTPPKPH